MTPDELRHLAPGHVPTLPPLLRALWYEAHGNWDRAHALAQDVDTPDGARVHAFLHRREGDTSNADYWYRQAGVATASGPLEAEWEALANDLLSA